MRIVIVDDSISRVSLIKQSLESRDFYKYLEVIYCDSADSGRRALLDPSDLLLLDVLIPKKTNGTPQAKHSIELLRDICSAKKAYIRPRLIMGLTADISEIGGYQSEFAKEATIVLRGTSSEVSWLDSFVQQIESILGAHRKIGRIEKERLLITVHGIRTYGHWQSDISAEISQHSRSFECVEIKYEFLDLLSFLIPALRQRKIETMAARILINIRAYPDREIFIIGHSFGSLIVANALCQVKPKTVKTTMFCGSPMRHNEDIDKVILASEMTLNDCGIHDSVLVLARFLGLGLGDAGRIGFERENSDSFRNRYFRGGHGLYFSKIAENVNFYNKYWLPMMVSDEKPLSTDVRRDYIGHDIVDLFVKFMTFVKPLWYICPPICLAFWLMFQH